MNIYLNISIVSQPAADYVSRELIKEDVEAHEKLKAEALVSGKSFMTPQDTSAYDVAVKAVEGQQVLEITVFEGAERTAFTTPAHKPVEQALRIAEALSSYAAKRFV